MAQIEELQARITRALDRIGAGIDTWEPAHVTAELAAMRAQTEKSMAEAEEARAELAQLRAEMAAAAEAEPEQPVDVAPEADPEEIVALREALEDEKLANAQLEERLRTLGSRQDSNTADLREQVAAQREGMDRLDGELQRLRASNEALRATVTALREANAQGVGEPDLINKALAEELEAVLAVRASEAAETRAVLDVLTPLLGQAAGDTVEQEETV